MHFPEEFGRNEANLQDDTVNEVVVVNEDIQLKDAAALVARVWNVGIIFYGSNDCYQY